MNYPSRKKRTSFLFFGPVSGGPDRALLQKKQTSGG
jgi:hypothetical protein